MNDLYSPQTGEHIQSNNPAEWMAHAGVAAPIYDRASEGCFWRGAAWEVVAAPAHPSVDEIWEKIKAEREHLSDTGGYKVVVGGVDKWFHSDPKSKTQQLGLVLMGADVVNVPPWKTMDGTFVTMTQTLAGQIFTAAATMDGTLFAVAESHSAAMRAAPDPAAYDYSVGWPAVYVQV